MNLMELKDKRVLVVDWQVGSGVGAVFEAHGARGYGLRTKSGDELRNEIPTLLDHELR